MRFDIHIYTHENITTSRTYPSTPNVSSCPFAIQSYFLPIFPMFRSIGFPNKFPPFILPSLPHLPSVTFQIPLALLLVHRASS